MRISPAGAALLTLFLSAAAREKYVPGGVEIEVEATGRALGAAHRMVPAHASELDRRVVHFRLSDAAGSLVSEVVRVFGDVAGDGIYTMETTVPYDAPPGTYYVTIAVTDKEGNTERKTVPVKIS